MGGPRPMTTVPLTVVASSAVGRARSGNMPTIGSTRMTARPTARCLHEDNLRSFTRERVKVLASDSDQRQGYSAAGMRVRW